MADGDGCDPPLGLRRLARIADDEGVDDGQGARDDLRKAGFAKRHRLARQPFERAMRADMDDGMTTERLPKPQAEGDEFVEVENAA